MKLFSEKVEFTSTDSSFNIIQVRDYNEIFFGVYEIEINKAKYPVEKISEHNGKPVVSVPVEVGGKKRYYPFVLSKGKQEILFNESNDEDSFEVEVKVIEEGIEENITIIEEIEDDAVPEISENTEILDQIKRAKSNAKKQLVRIKRENLKNIREDFNKKETLLEKTLNDARDSLVSEFIDISNKIKDDILGDNDDRYDEIKITLDNKIEELSESLKSEIDNNFDKSSEYLDKNLRKLVSESIKSINKNVDSKIGESVETLSIHIDEKVDNSLGVFTKVNVELNDRLNKGVNKALSRVGNIDKKIDSLDVDVNDRITLAENNLKDFYKDNIKILEDRTFDITEETRQQLIEMIRESRDGLLKEFREVKGLNPIEYIIEDSNGKKETIKYDKLIKDLEKRIDSEVTRMRRYVNVYGGGGGTVAMQFADGGTMRGDLIVDGNLTVTGTVSADGVSGGDGGSISPFYNKTLFKYNLEVGDNNVQTFAINTDYNLIQSSFTITFSTITSKNSLKFDCVINNGVVIGTGYGVLNSGDDLYTNLNPILSGGFLYLNLSALKITQMTIIGEATYEPGLDYEGSVMIGENNSIFISENSDIFVLE